jgi:predicted RNase H-like HicB family nuclease
MTDAVIIARGEGNDRAYVPEIPGGIATGKTREETN